MLEKDYAQAKTMLIELEEEKKRLELESQQVKYAYWSNSLNCLSEYTLKYMLVIRLKI